MTTRYRFVGAHIDNLADGHQLEPGDYVELDDREGDERLFADGLLVAAPEKAEKAPKKEDKS